MERKKTQESNLCDRFDRFENQLNLNSEVKNTRLDVMLLKEELHGLKRILGEQIIKNEELNQKNNKAEKREEFQRMREVQLNRRVKEFEDLQLYNDETRERVRQDTAKLQEQVAKLDEEGVSSRKREGFLRMRDLQLNRRVKEYEDLQLNERLSEVEELIRDNNLRPTFGCMGVNTCCGNKKENNSYQLKTETAGTIKPHDSNPTSTESKLPQRRKNCFIL